MVVQTKARAHSHNVVQNIMCAYKHTHKHEHEHKHTRSLSGHTDFVRCGERLWDRAVEGPGATGWKGGAAYRAAVPREKIV